MKLVTLVDADPESEEARVLRDAGFDVRIVTDEAHQKTTRRFELLSDTASQLLLTDDPQGLVQSLCEKVMATLGCHAFFNFLVDAQADSLRLNACAGIPDDVQESIRRLDYGVAVCGCVARDGCRIVAEDILNNPDPRTDLVRGFGIQAYACNPLLSQGGRVIGTLSFGSRTEAHFCPDELDLMKAVADQVAAAMERIRLLDEARERAQALVESESRIRRLVESSMIGVLFTGPSGEITEANDAFLDMTGYARQDLMNGSLSWARLTPVERRSSTARAIAESLAHGSCKPYETECIRADGSTVPVLVGLALLEGSNTEHVGYVLDISERKHAQERERELESHKRDFYRRTILAATEGKLLVCERHDVDSVAGVELGSWHIGDLADIGQIRDAVRRLAESAGMEPSRIPKFVGCAMEAAANAHKHAAGGIVSLLRTDAGLLLRVSDTGPGIGAIALPDIALTKGYSTAGTLGMGYKIMIRFADQVYLATGPDGTTVAFEMRLDGGADPSPDHLPANVTAWTTT